MSDLSKIKVGSTTYDIKDAVAREELGNFLPIIDPVVEENPDNYNLATLYFKDNNTSISFWDGEPDSGNNLNVSIQEDSDATHAVALGLSAGSNDWQTNSIITLTSDGDIGISGDSVSIAGETYTIANPSAFKDALQIIAATTVQPVSSTAVVGISPLYARADHVHNITKATITTALGYTPPTADTNTTYSAATTVQPVATAAVTGTSTAYARADHVHNITGATITNALGFTPQNYEIFDHNVDGLVPAPDAAPYTGANLYLTPHSDWNSLDADSVLLGETMATSSTIGSWGNDQDLAGYLLELENSIASGGAGIYVEKAGDTMTGDLHLLETDITKNGTPTSTYYGGELKFTDSNDDQIGYIGTYQSVEGGEGLNIGTSRTVNGNSKYNSVLMEIQSNGTKKISFDDLDTKVAWQNALSMPTAATTVKAIATAAVTGTSTAYARADHVHNITKATITAALGVTPIGASSLDDYARLDASNTFSGSALAQIIQDTVIDTTSANNGVSSTKYLTFGMKDKKGNYINWWQSCVTTAGVVQMQIGARNIVSSSNVNNTLTLGIKKNGETVVGVSDTAAWQDTLKIPAPATTVKNIGTASVTGTSTAYARADHVHDITSATITSVLGFTPFNSASTLGVAHGGTGKTTATEAWTNLGGGSIGKLNTVSAANMTNGLKAGGTITFSDCIAYGYIGNFATNSSVSSNKDVNIFVQLPIAFPCTSLLTVSASNFTTSTLRWLGTDNVGHYASGWFTKGTATVHNITVNQSGIKIQDTRTLPATNCTGMTAHMPIMLLLNGSITFKS